MVHSMDYYLNKGFDPAYAEYFTNGRRHILDVKPDNDYTLILTFDNHEKRVYDMKPSLKPGTVFEVLKDKNIFERVYLDEDHVVSWDIDPNLDSKIYWNNKIDISPDTCYVDGKSISKHA